MRHCLLVLSAAIFALASASGQSAQNFATSRCPDAGRARSGGLLGWLGGQERACELRLTTLPLNGALRIKGENGGIEVLGEDRPDISLEARVEAHASTRSGADSLLREIRVRTDGTITAEGPRISGPSRWSVGYRLRVPRHIAAELATSNGSIELSSLEGDIRARTVNGGLSLRDLAGDVHATTTNGGAAVSLAGTTWRGHGLSVQSTNGSFSIQMPGSYSAHLVAQTTNGRISGEFANRADSRHHTTLETNEGQGGPTLDFTTTNGGIAFLRN